MSTEFYLCFGSSVLLFQLRSHVRSSQLNRCLTAIQCQDLSRRKQHKGQASNGGNNSSNVNESEKVARRVNSDTLMPVKTQLRLLKRIAEMNREQKPRTRTSFRRKKEDGLLETSSDEECGDGSESGALKRRRRKGRKGKDSLPSGKYSLTVPPLCFVDGYNVIGVWKKLKKRWLAGNISSARDELLHEVSQFSAYRGWKCVVVFDGQGSPPEASFLGQRAADIEYDTAHGVAVVYTRAYTADQYIEMRTGEACSAGERQVWAATSDLIQQRVAQAVGAHVMTSSMLVQEIKRARRESLLEVEDEKLRLINQMGQRLIDNVSSQTRDALYDLRSRLDAA